MDIIKKHKKAFIIIVIVAALLTGFMGLSMAAFMIAPDSSTIEITNEEVVTQEKIVQQTEKYNELDFSNGPVIFKDEYESKDITTGGGDVMVAYLQEGDMLEIEINAKVKKGSLNFDLNSKDGSRYGGTVTGTNSFKDTVFIDEDGNYIFDYSMDNFKGSYEITIAVTRP